MMACGKIPAVEKAFESSTACVSLNGSGVSGRELVLAVCSRLAAGTGITQLELENNALEAESIGPICEMLKKGAAGLTSLDLSLIFV